MAVMKSLVQKGTVAPEILRFDGGMVNLRELIWLMAEALVTISPFLLHRLGMRTIFWRP